MSDLAFKTLSVKQPAPFVCHVELNRPEKYNAFNMALWTYVFLLSFDLLKAIDLCSCGSIFVIAVSFENALMV